MNIPINDLEDNTVIKLAKALNEQNFDDISNINLIFSDNITFTPFGMLLSASCFRKILSDNSYIDFKLLMNGNDNSNHYAGTMGYFKSILPACTYGKFPGEASGSLTYIPITNIRFEIPREGLGYKYMNMYQYIKSESERLAKVVSAGNKNLELLLTYLLTEILRNTQEHAKVKSAWVCAQCWNRKGYAEVAILDEGIGILNSISKKYKKIDNDADAIKLALKPGITEAYISPNSIEDDNSGFGLYVCSEICKELGGKFLIISGETAYSKMSGNISVVETNFKGTVIKLKININMLGNAQNLINMVVDRGEEIMKKHGLEGKASEKSRGLSLLL